MQLPDDSRVKRKISGYACTRQEFLTAVAADRLGLLIWAQTKDGQKGRNRPKSLAEALMGATEPDENNEIEAFDTPEAFEMARNALINGSR